MLHRKLNDVDPPGDGKKHGGKSGKHDHDGKHGGKHGVKHGKHGKASKHPKHPKLRNLGIPGDGFPEPEGKPAPILKPEPAAPPPAPSPSPSPKFMFHESVHGGAMPKKRDVDVDAAEVDQDEVGEAVNEPDVQAEVNDGAWESDDEQNEDTDDESDTEPIEDPTEVYMDEFEPDASEDDDTAALTRRGVFYVGPASIQPICMKKRSSGRKVDGPLSPQSKDKHGITKQCKVKAARRIWCYKNPGRCYHFHRKFFMQVVKLLRIAKAKDRKGSVTGIKGGHHSKGGKGKGRGVYGKPEGRPAPGTRPHAVPHRKSKHESRPAPGTRPHEINEPHEFLEPPNGGIRKFHKGITGYGGRPNPHVLPGGVVPKPQLAKRDLQDQELDDEDPELEVDDGDDDAVDPEDTDDDIDTDTDDETLTDDAYDSDNDSEPDPSTPINADPDHSPADNVRWHLE